MALAVGFVAFSLYFNDERTTHLQLDSLARDYYEKYLYDEHLQRSNRSSEEIFSRFSEKGLGRILLRQLLVFDEKNHGDAREKLNKKCDTNKTYVVYYPKSPYGKTDYEFEYVYSCNFD